MNTLSKRLFKLADIVLLFIMILSNPMTVLAAVWTDQPDYTPGSVVTIRGDNSDGAGYLPGETVQVNVIGPYAYAAACEGIADANGAWSCQVTLWTGLEAVGDYSFTATGLTSGVSQKGTFTDANSSANLDQCANGQTGLEPCSNSNWVNGNLGFSKSLYYEGDSIPYRVVFDKLALGSHTVTIEWDTTKSSKHALDYLTTWDRSANPGSDPLSGVAGTFSPPTTYAIPADPQVTGAGVTQIPGFFTLYNGTITAVSAYSYSNGPGFSGDKSASLAITFTATSPTAVLAWGGHIATRMDWGIGNSAVAIEGSPFHTRLLALDGSGGNQDRSLSNDAVVFPGSITIIKDAAPEGATSFNFTASPAPLYNFTLVDDGTPANKIVFGGIKNFTTYTVTESVPAGWNLTGIVCTVLNPSSGSQIVSLPNVTINLKEAEGVTCTFSNSVIPVYALNVEKSSTTTAVTATGQVVPYAFLVTNTGNVPLSGITVTDPKCDANPAYQTGDTNTNNKLDVSETWTYTCNHTVTQAEIDSNGGGDGDLDNTVTADSTESGPDTDDYFIPITQTAAINVEKSSTSAAITAAGQVVPYSFTVTNAGNVTLSGITVSDPNCSAAPVYQSGDANLDNKLQTTETWIYTCSHTVTQTEIDSNGGGDGDLDNTVTADSNESAPDTDSYFIPITYNPLLSINKVGAWVDGDADAYADVGEAINYTFAVKNEGNVTLTNVTVTDPKVSPITCPATTLAVGASMTCTGSYVLIQSDIDAGKVENTATADSDESGPASDSETVNLPQNAMLSIIKTGAWGDGDADGFADVGEAINYTFAVKNEGNVTLTNVTVTDPKVAVVGGPTTLDVGETDTTTFTGVYHLTQIDIDAGHFFNTATADSKESGPASDDEDVTLLQNPHLTITKVATETSYNAVDQVIHYTIVATNDGNTTLAAVTVTDPKVSGLTCTPANGSALAPGASLNCTATHTVTQSDIDAGHYANQACVDDGELGAAKACASKDVPGIKNPHLTITKVATETSYNAVDQVIHYTITARNDGNTTLAAVTVTDPNVSGLVCTPANGSSLAPGASLICTATHTITQSDIDAGHYANQACVDDGTGGAVEACASQDVPGIKNPHLTITKVATETSYNAVDQVIHYTIVATNDGNTTLAAVTVTDPKVSGLTCTPANGSALAPGASLTCSATHTVTLSDIDARSYLNTACVDDGTGGAAEVCASATVPAVQSPALSLTKTASPTTYDTVGQSIQYTYGVKNTGNVTLSAPYAVSDDKVASVTCPNTPASLAPNASVTCTGSYLITQANLDDGKVVNTATATARFGANTITSNQATATITADQKPAITVDKTAVPTSVNEPGGNVLFTFKVTNSGNVTLTIASLADTDFTLTGDADCQVGTVLAVGGTCEFSQTQFIAGDASDPDHINTFTATATDKAGHTAMDEDSAAVGFDDVKPAITVDKTAVPTSVNEPGGNVVFTFKVTNTSVEPVTIASLTDTAFTLTGDADCQVGTILPVGGTCEFSQTEFIAGDASDPDHANTFTATATDNDGNTATNSDSAAVGFDDVKPTIELTKTANPLTLPEPGGIFNFTLTIHNTSPEAVTITVLFDQAPLSPECIGLVNTSIAAGASVSCTNPITHTEAGIYPNTAGVTVKDNENNTASASDSETVIVTDVKPTADLTKSAVPATLPEPGGVFTFTLSIHNTSVEAVTITTLTDTNALSAQCLALVGTSLASGASTSCTYTVTKNEAGSYPNTAEVTVKDNENNTATDTDSETITVTDVKPVVELTKAVTPATLPEPGGAFHYTLTITNKSVENVTITALTDDNALPSACTDLIDDVLTPGQSVSCTYDVTHTEAGIYPNTAGVTVKDNENNPASDSDSETVTVTDVKPTVDLTKTAVPATLPEPGGVFTFTLSIHNTSVEAVTITTLTDTNALSAQCLALVGTSLAAGASTSCTYTVTKNEAGSYPNTAEVTVKDNENNPASDSDTKTVTVTDVKPVVELTKAVTPATLPEPGGAFHYTLTITNKSVENVTITDLTDTNLLSAGCTDLINDVLTPGQSVSCTYDVNQTEAGTYPNTASVTVADNEQNPASASDSETVTVTDVKPSVDLTKTAVPATLPEPGGVFTFTLSIHNTSVEAVTITALTDTNALSAQCLALINTAIPAGGTVSCTYTVTHNPINTYENTASVTVADNEKNTATDTDKETVTVTDVKPSIVVDKTASKTSVLFTGEAVTFTIKVTNTSIEPVVLKSLVDDKYGDLDKDTLAAHSWVTSTCDIPQTIPAGATYTCAITACVDMCPLKMEPFKTYTHINTVTGTAYDDEGNPAVDSDDAVITFYWRGRTPGYWKNHSGTWPKFTVRNYKSAVISVTNSTPVLSLFNVPRVLLKCGATCILDLNKDGRNDTLLQALAYKGGDGLTGKAQILLRAAVAGLLNEAYFKSTYPAYSSVTSLISAVNTTLATRSETAYVTLANVLDWWNNGVH